MVYDQGLVMMRSVHATTVADLQNGKCIMELPNVFNFFPCCTRWFDKRISTKCGTTQSQTTAYPFEIHRCLRSSRVECRALTSAMKKTKVRELTLLIMAMARMDRWFRNLPRGIATSERIRNQTQNELFPFLRDGTSGNLELQQKQHVNS